MMLSRGSVVDGRYRIEEEIKQGSFSTVYKVAHVHLGGVFALKVLDSSSREVAERFMMEGHIQAQLWHPHIVQVLDWILLGDRPALLIDYPEETETLNDVVRRAGPFDEQEGLAILQPILSAVAAAHAVGVTHRDLRPANILMAKRMGDWHPMIADFGIATVLAEDPQGMYTRQVLDTSGVIAPGFVAPEQLTNASQVDDRADVYGVGALAYWIFSGCSPFEDNSGKNTMATMFSDPYPLRRFAPDVAQSIERAISEAMLKDLDRRTASVEQFSNALFDDELEPRITLVPYSQILPDEPVVSEPPAFVEPVSAPAPPPAFVEPVSASATPPAVVELMRSSSAAPSALSDSTTPAALVEYGSHSTTSSALVKYRSGELTLPPHSLVTVPAAAVRPRRASTRWILSSVAAVLVSVFLIGSGVLAVLAMFALEWMGDNTKADGASQADAAHAVQAMSEFDGPAQSSSLDDGAGETPVVETSTSTPPAPMLRNASGLSDDLATLPSSADATDEPPQEDDAAALMNVGATGEAPPQEDDAAALMDVGATGEAPPQEDDAAALMDVGATGEAPPQEDDAAAALMDVDATGEPPRSDQVAANAATAPLDILGSWSGRAAGVPITLDIDGSPHRVTATLTLAHGAAWQVVRLSGALTGDQLYLEGGGFVLSGTVGDNEIVGSHERGKTTVAWNLRR